MAVMPLVDAAPAIYSGDAAVTARARLPPLLSYLRHAARAAADA